MYFINYGLGYTAGTRHCISDRWPTKLYLVSLIIFANFGINAQYLLEPTYVKLVDRCLYLSICQL